MKNNWQTKKLGEIGTIFNGNSINERVKKEKYLNLEDGLPFVATKDIDFETHSIDYDNGVKIPLAEKNFKIAHKNSVLICAEGGNAGKKMAFNYKDICFGNKLFAIETGKEVDPKYVYYWYLTDEFSKLFKNQIFGLIGGVSLNNFREIEISFPLLAEQKRIVKILDDTFSQVVKAKENTENNLKNSKQLFESYLENIFANPGEDWEEMELKKVCVKLFAGGDVPKDNFSKFETDKFSIPIFSNGIGENALYGYTDIKRVSEPSVTISARGTIGYPTVRRIPFYPIIRLIVATPNKGIINIDFLNYFVSSLKFSNTGSSIPQLTIPMIENQKILFPSLEKQEKIVKKLNKLSVETKKLEGVYQKKIADLEEFKKSILQKAFAGEL